MHFEIVILWTTILIGFTLFVRNYFNKGAQAFNDHIEKNEYQTQPKLQMCEAIKLILLLPILLIAIAILWQFLFTKQWTASIVFSSIMLIFIALYYWSKKTYNSKKV